MSNKNLITEKDILDLILSGQKKMQISGKEIITPAARDKINEAKIKLVKSNQRSCGTTDKTSGSLFQLDRLAIGSDHTGFQMKRKLIQFLEKQNFKVIDVGTNDEKSCDYPDYAAKVSTLIQNNEVYFGILLDATGIPSAITANKFKGIRAVTCYNEFSARSSREHNNANCLVLGAKTLGEETIKSITDVWLNSEFLGDRHQRRLDKITEIENLNQ